MIVDAGQYTITRQLPKTGQVTSYAAGDDGDYEAGWWIRRLNANNRIRFLTRTIAGDDIVLDRATGLMWPQDWSLAGANNGATLDWGLSTVWANNLNFAGFTNWRLPNVNELLSLIHYESGLPYIWSAFINVATNRPYWSSTTDNAVTLNAYEVRFYSPSFNSRVKTYTNRHVAVRKGV